MKRLKVLYITNIQVPYRQKEFELLSKKCNLTVLYERKKSGNRDESWASKSKTPYKQYFLEGIPLKNESTFSIGILKYISAPYDVIIIGCYSTPVQIFANLYMTLRRKKFIMVFDGEPFALDGTFKSKIKRFLLKNASLYLAGGQLAAENIKKIVGNKPVFPFYFSSLTDKEIKENWSLKVENRENYILVVGQYFDYKGLDVAIKAAEMMPEQKFLFVGMGKRTELFIKECNTDDIPNVTTVPFMDRTELFEEYKKCRCLLLPSRRECWGLVVNEAASFGTPIVSTWGSGAAVEFLGKDYPFLLAEPGNAQSLVKCIKQLESMNTNVLSEYLKEKSAGYSTENMAATDVKAIKEVYRHNKS